MASVRQLILASWGLWALTPAVAGADNMMTVPVPDPTIMTTQMIRGDITALKNLLEARLDAMDKATVVLDANVNRLPSLLDREITHTNVMVDEKFAAVEARFHERDTRFVERDRRSDQDKAASGAAIGAALVAQKEAFEQQNISNAAAITKSENAFTKEIDGLKFLMTSNKDAVYTQINDVAGRLNRSEAAVSTRREVVTDDRASVGSVLGMVGGAVGVLSLLLAAFTGLARRHEAGVSVTQPNATGGIGIGAH